MHTEREFIAAILLAPDDHTLRLVFADWLQENGQEERAELVRVQVELARLGDSGQCPRCKVSLSPLKKDRVPLLAGCTKCGYQGGFWTDAVKTARAEATFRARESELARDALAVAVADVVRELSARPTASE